MMQVSPVFVYNEVVDQVKLRNPNAPITAKDWFLHDLFNDPTFVEVRSSFKTDATKYDPIGISSLIGKSTSEEISNLVLQYVARLCDMFQINEQTAVKGLFVNEYKHAWSRQRVPVAYIDGKDILIRIGPETRPDDVLGLWKSIIELQNKLKPHRSKRDTQPKEPSLAFIIHKHVIAGEKIADIYRDYSFEKLSGYSGVANINTVEDFRKYYKGIVEGFKSKG